MRESARMITLEIDLQMLCESEQKRDYFAIHERNEFECELIACFLFGISMHALRHAKTRKREVVKARQFCMWFLKNKTPMTLSTIGQRYGDKDHATVLHACNVVENLIFTKDIGFYPLIQEFKNLTDYENISTFEKKSVKERRTKVVTG